MPANKKTTKKSTRKFRLPILSATPARLQKPVILAILVLASTLGVYVAFLAQASGIPNIVSVATSQIGVTEVPKGSNAGPACKYQGSGCAQAWCADFVSWVYQQAGYSFSGGADGGWRIGMASGVRNWFQVHGNWYPRGSADIPQPGDVLYSVNSRSDHVGIVDHTDGTTLYTIDGNWSDSVARVSYPNYRSDSTIGGWGRLKSSTPNTTATGSTNEYFIKTRNTPGTVEVHRASAASNYQVADLHTTTWFSSADTSNGTWQMVGPDLYFIKTMNTGGGSVEVHSATAASGYKSGIHARTWFSSADTSNGTWQMVGPDLYFIKTVGGANGHVEVHSATAASGYQSGVHYSTWFPSTDNGNGVWQIVGRDLYFIKTRNTPGTVEVHRASAASNYQVADLHTTTWFSSADTSNGTWQMVGPDLYFIKTMNTGGGSVEVHSATAASGYRSGVHYPTWFSNADTGNGVWELN